MSEKGPQPAMNAATALIVFILLSFSCLADAQAMSPQPKAQAKPNILIVLSDDAGYADFGFTGGTDIPTPHLDRMAAEGVFCSQGYVTASVCCPSRMGLMTGRYQQRFGAENNVPTLPTPGFGDEDLGMDPGESNIAALLKAGGYRTATFGKWHLGEHEHHHPNARGNDEFFGLLGGSRSYWPEPKYGPDHPNRILRNREPVDEAAELTYLTDDLTDEAIRFIEAGGSEPFFVYLSFTAPHGPLHARDDYLERFAAIADERRRTYAAMLSNMDDNIGRVLKTLRDRGLEENTLVFFLNDNGGATGNGSSNGSLRGWKGSYWEGGIRVPFLVKWPGKIPPGQVYTNPVIALDVGATALAAAGVEADRPLDGVDLVPYLSGQVRGVPHQTLYWRSWRVAACRSGDWKLVEVKESALEEKRNTLLPAQLYDLKADPSETTDLASQHPEMVKQLSQKLAAWESRMEIPRWYDGRNWQHWQKVQVENHR